MAKNCKTNQADMFTDSTMLLKGPDGVSRSITFTQAGNKSFPKLALVDNELALYCGFENRLQMLTVLGHAKFKKEKVWFSVIERRFYILKDLDQSSKDVN